MAQINTHALPQQELTTDAPYAGPANSDYARFQLLPNSQKRDYIPMNTSLFAINDLKISQFKPDEATIDKSRIYIKYAVGAGKTRLDQKYIEKKLNLVATIRNWNTVTTLLEMFE